MSASFTNPCQECGPCPPATPGLCDGFAAMADSFGYAEFGDTVDIYWFSGGDWLRPLPDPIPVGAFASDARKIWRCGQADSHERRTPVNVPAAQSPWAKYGGFGVWNSAIDYWPEAGGLANWSGYTPEPDVCRYRTATVENIWRLADTSEEFYRRRFTHTALPCPDEDRHLHAGRNYNGSGAAGCDGRLFPTSEDMVDHRVGVNGSPYHVPSSVGQPIMARADVDLSFGLSGETVTSNVITYVSSDPIKIGHRGMLSFYTRCAGERVFLANRVGVFLMFGQEQVTANAYVPLTLYIGRNVNISIRKELLKEQNGSYPAMGQGEILIPVEMSRSTFRGEITFYGTFGSYVFTDAAGGYEINRANRALWEPHQVMTFANPCGPGTFTIPGMYVEWIENVPAFIRPIKVEQTVVLSDPIEPGWLFTQAQAVVQEVSASEPRPVGLIRNCLCQRNKTSLGSGRCGTTIQDINCGYATSGFYYPQTAPPP